MTADRSGKILGISRTVFTLGIVSFLTDISSEMLVPIVPQFLRFALGTPGQMIGLIEGIAESTASVLRVYAGYLADRFGRPKLLTVIGYGLSAVSKPFFLLATSWSYVLGIRFADRFGKGIRSAPRDVLIADATEEAVRGRAFGFHRAMDTAGATFGPLIIVLLLFYLGEGFIVAPSEKQRSLYHMIFIAATVPAVLGWLVLAIFVPERKREEHVVSKPELKLSALDRQFKIFLGIVTLFAIGNSSDAFLVLRATSSPSKGGVGMPFVTFLGVYVAFNALSAVVAARSGILSDRIGRKPVIVMGWLVFSAVYFAIARVGTQTGIWVWFVIYGIYYGMTEGMLRAMAIDLAPPYLRGTAVGAYFTFSGVALLPASLIAGFLWDNVSPAAPFYYGAITSLAAALLLGTLVKPGRTAEDFTSRNSRDPI